MAENLSWTSEFVRSFKNVKELYHYLQFPLTPEQEAVAQRYPVFIPRRLADRIKETGPEGTLAKEFLPAEEELSPAGLPDPIGDKEYLRAPQLIHRYPSRALFTPTSVCPVHCRYCFRKNELSSTSEIFERDLAETMAYLKNHPEISEIIFTGGDPFSLSTEKLSAYLEAFARIESIKDVRFHTRYAVILPERFDQELLALLRSAAKQFRTVSIALHINHVDEIDSQSYGAIQRLSRLPLQLLSQTVLLRGINNNTQSLTDLMSAFMELKVRPYYLHHPDQVKGGLHFSLPLEEGRKLYLTLRNRLPGWALPHYIIDIPGGHGKTQAFNPESTLFSGTLLSREGERVRVREPDFFI